MLLRSRYRILNCYISKEFFQNFLVAFLFFFCIFFVNSILLLIERILLKNIDFLTMLEMVALSMPQFLVYTFPFATLTASSMILGDFSTLNELMAIRSSGIATRQVYFPIIAFSLGISLLTFFTSDVLLPYSSVIYRNKLATLMADMPTFELESNSVNTVGNIVLYNGEADGREIRDLVLMTKGQDDMNETVISKKGTLELIDPFNYVYSLDLDNPTIFLNDSKDIESFVLADAERATFFLDFSSQIPSLTTNSPVNLTSRELIEEIAKRNIMQEENRRDFYSTQENVLLSTSETLKNLAKGNLTTSEARISIEEDYVEYMNIGTEPVNFTGQYYKAELTKKLALSTACLFLTLITLPLSNIRMKHGKLTGFAISLIVAVAYWYMLFAAQLMIFDISSSPYLLIFSPNLIIFALAMVALIYFRKARS